MGWKQYFDKGWTILSAIYEDLLLQMVIAYLGNIKKKICRYYVEDT